MKGWVIMTNDYPKRIVLGSEEYAEQIRAAIDAKRKEKHRRNHGYVPGIMHTWKDEVEVAE